MPKSILVVDDDESVADSLRLLLKIDGHEVEVAGDGETALAKYKVGNHDLVIADFFDAGDGWFGVGAID
jgi:DNA-binding response OmpR family regulator